MPDDARTLTVEPWRRVDFERFGPVDRRALSRIRHRIIRRLARNWVLIPHVTHQDRADIAELERLRPIINAPEVAILGVTRPAVAPLRTGAEFVPRLMLALSLSYDHRVIDGADAARFTVRLAELLSEEIPGELDAYL